MNTNEIITKALSDIENLLTSYKDSDSKADNKKADLLSYWLSDYCKMLKKEVTFDPTKLKRYKRGEVVKAHLGYNIGSEEGGLHYAIVLDKNNSPSNPNITIIPLTSVKPHTDLERLHPTKVFLGDYIYKSLIRKALAQEEAIVELYNNTKDSIAELQNTVDSYSDDELLEYKLTFIPKIEELNAKSEELVRRRKNNQKLQSEISKMKAGSIALITQITTISKIRIYDPLHADSTLSGIRLSSEQLDLIDNKIKEFYIGIE